MASQNERAATIAAEIVDKDHHEDTLLALVRKYGDAYIVADDGNAEVEYDALAYHADQAAHEYVDDGSWGSDGSATSWVNVYTWTRYRLGDVEVDLTDRRSHSVAIEPDEPGCEGGSEHDWQSPIEIVGGIAENPGVWGHGGGVIINECCMACGCRRTTDTWAQNPDNGEQGLTSVAYEPDAYLEELRAQRLSAASDALHDAGYDLSRASDETRLIVAVSDGGDGDAGALDEIRAIVAEHRCSAEWTGSGNTETDGRSTSDIRVDPLPVP